MNFGMLTVHVYRSHLENIRLRVLYVVCTLIIAARGGGGLQNGSYSMCVQREPRADERAPVASVQRGVPPERRARQPVRERRLGQHECATPFPAAASPPLCSPPSPSPSPFPSPSPRPARCRRTSPLGLAFTTTTPPLPLPQCTSGTTACGTRRAACTGLTCAARTRWTSTRATRRAPRSGTS